MSKEKYTWDFSAFCLDDEDFEQRVKNLNDKLDEILKDNSKSLKVLLSEYYECKLEHEKLNTYAELNGDLDLTSTRFQDYKKQVAMIHDKLSQALEIINSKITKDNITYQEFLAKYPDLEAYKMHIYEVLRNIKHQNNDSNVTRLTNEISDINQLYYTIMNTELEYESLEIDGEKVIINVKNFNRYKSHSDRDIRKQVLETFLNSLKKVNRSISGLLSMRMKACAEVAKLKGYNSVLEQLMSEDDLDLSITKNLIESVHKNIPLLRKYISLKGKMIKIDDIKYYDLGVKNTLDFHKDFEDAIVDVKNALTIMGENYNHILNNILDSGCLDVYPKKNKFPGGYNWRNYTKPMILMNYNPTFTGVKTIAHECGHAVNAVMISNNHEYQDFHFSLFLSETASKVNENILEHYYLNNASEELKKYILEEQLSNFVESVFMQSIYFELEDKLYQALYDGKEITYELINSTFADLFIEYYGNIYPKELIQYFWQTRIHYFYQQNKYYNFQYATGLISALKISEGIINGSKDKLNKYLEFLTIGGSLPTLDALKVADVDYKNGNLIDESMIIFAKMLENYEEIIKREET